MRTTLGLALCLVLLALPAAAEDAPATPPTPGQAADAVLEAVQAQDGATLRALAEKARPDPWMVADELVRRGAFHVAEAFAVASPRKAVERLAAYVASRRDKADDPARRERQARVDAAFQAGDMAGALEAAGPAGKEPPDDVVGVLLATGRGIALVRLARNEEAAATSRAAAEAAERLGWWAQAAHAYHAVGWARYQASAFAAAEDAWGRSLALWEAVGNRAKAAMLLLNLGDVCESQGARAKQLGYFERASVAFEAVGDATGASIALANVGCAHLALGAPAEALSSFERALAAMEALGDQAGAAWVLRMIGTIHYDRCDWRKALACDERTLALWEALGNEVGVAEALARIGIEIYRLGRHEEALVVYARALALQQALGNEGDAAATLGNIANVYLDQGDAAKALATQERALAAKEALGDRAGAAVTLANIGRAHGALGDFAAAVAACERAREGFAKLGNEGEAAWVLGTLGDVHAQGGDLEKALEIYAEALAAQEALGDRTAVGNLLLARAGVQRLRGDGRGALASYEQALSTWEALGNRAQLVQSLILLGQLHIDRGDYARALAALQRALAIAEDLEDTSATAGVLFSLGVVHTYAGEYAKALELDERALAVQQAAGDEAGAAATMCSIGVVYHGLGDLPKALAQYERALAAAEAVRATEVARTTLYNMAEALVDLGEPDRALAVAGRAQVLNATLGLQAHTSVGLAVMGRIHEARGDVAQALAAHEQALAAAEARADKRAALGALIAIGSIQARIGPAAKGIQTLERAVRAAEKMGGNAELVKALEALAAARLASGDGGRALSDAHRAVLLLKTLVSGLGEEQGATARGQYTELFSTGLAAAAQAQDAAEAVFFLESGRAGSLLESLGARQALRWQSIPADLREAEVDARAGEARALVAYTKALDGGDRAAVRALNAQLEAARANVADVVERIQREAKKEAQLWYPVATPIEDIQAYLEPDEALLLYGLASKEGEAYALVVTQAEARIVPLGPSSDIVAACASCEPADPDGDPSAALAGLRHLLIEPLELAKETKRLLVSPEGPLSYVPFAALVPDLDLAYESSGTTYGVLLETRGRRGEKVLALADPDYGARFNPTALDLYAPVATREATRGSLRLAPLPGTRAEAMAVADERLFGSDASEAGLQKALAGSVKPWLAVHFACHGLVDPERPTMSSLALTPDAENDGFLTALEVLQLRIPADLVVLSACETGKGKIARGEGIVGLTRAFTYAGAPRVICSLWKVDDTATQALMIRFYELWNPKEGEGLSAAEALRLAQAHVRDHPDHPDWKHPYYWAAWVLWGLPE